MIAVFLAAAAITGALAAPAAASAQGGHRLREPASISAEIHGHGTGGFHFFFSTFGPAGSVLWFTKQPSGAGEESVFYLLRSHRGRGGLKGGAVDVRFGRLGRFRGRFVRTSTKTENPRDGCTGEPTTTEKGYFVGIFRFHGERGYTTVDTHRVRGTVTRSGPTSCPSPSPPRHRRHRATHQEKEQREREQNKFRLLVGDAGVHLMLQAEREESPEPEEGSPTTFQVSVTEEIGRLEVSHNASAIDFGPGAAATFQTPNLAEPLVEVTLTPPAPFSGSATFHLDDPHTATWSGDLAVELSGLGKVPLTGDGIGAGLCKGPSNCTKTLPEPLQKQLETPFDASYYVGEATTKPAS